MDANTTFELVPVPPPSRVRVDQTAHSLGLLDGLKAVQGASHWRCGHCSQMQHIGAWEVWVPDSIRMSDPIDIVTEVCRQQAYNGSWTGWCLPCAKKLGQPPITRITVPRPHDGVEAIMIGLLALVGLLGLGLLALGIVSMF